MKKNNNGGQVAANTSTEAAAGAGAPSEGKTGVIFAYGSAFKADWPEPVKVMMEKIGTLGANHPRDQVDKDIVNEYAERMKDGAEFPPVVIFRDRDGLEWVADGCHRYEAAKMCGLADIKAVVVEGGERDAILFAVGANAEHGMRRTVADKRKAVTVLVQDKEWRGRGVNWIAQQCKVSWDLAKSVCAEYERAHPEETEDGKDKAKKCKRNGKEYLQKSAVSKPLPAHIVAIGEMRELACKARAVVPEGDAKLAESLDRVGSELHEILGKATGAKCRMAEGLQVPLNVYQHKLVGGISATPEFERKGLATHAVNVGLGCGHQCSYCSSPSLRCRLPAYGELQINPYGSGFAVIDPKSADRISKDKPKLTADNTVMLSTCDDAWSPEARKYGVGRKCMEVLLKETTARVRVLTKSSEVKDDLDVAKGSEGRVMVGLSTGIPCSREDVAKAVEPNASSIKDRLQALKQAKDQGFGTYAMLCPCLPLVADTEAALTVMFKSVNDCGVSDIWLEPVNARGMALKNTAMALRLAGLKAEADAVDAIRKEEVWSKYAAALAETAVKVAEAMGLADKLHILLYADKITDPDRERVKALGDTVILLGKDTAKAKDGGNSEAGDEGGETADGGKPDGNGADENAA